jgi:hypothetical protein
MTSSGAVWEIIHQKPNAAAAMMIANLGGGVRAGREGATIGACREIHSGFRCEGCGEFIGRGCGPKADGPTGQSIVRKEDAITGGV